LSNQPFHLLAITTNPICKLAAERNVSPVEMYLREQGELYLPK
jgi:hypothetical protein